MIFWLKIFLNSDWNLNNATYVIPRCVIRCMYCFEIPHTNCRHIRRWHSCNLFTVHIIDFGDTKNTIGQKTLSLPTYEQMDSMDCKPSDNFFRYLYNTQQTQETNIHALSGIRTRDPSNQAAADTRLRPRGQRDYSGDFGFKSRIGDMLSWLKRFPVILSPSKQLLLTYLKLGHDHFPSHS
jgi:hypothetical protein